MATLEKGLILIVGDNSCDINYSITAIKPKAIGFLCFTTDGLMNATMFVKDSGFDSDFCQFEILQGLDNKREFFHKATVLARFLSNECNSEVVAICTSPSNYEALALSAMLAHNNRAELRIDDTQTHLIIASSEAILISTLSEIVKKFNLFQYRHVLEELELLKTKVKTSKAKLYTIFIWNLATAYFEWDCRRYEKALEKINETKEMLESTPQDFENIKEYFSNKLQSNVEFLSLIIKKQETLGGIDAYFNGYRRYEASDNLVSILALANSIEFCLRARLLLQGFDPDDYKKLNKQLFAKINEKANDFFAKKKLYHVDKYDSEITGSNNAVVSLGFCYKPAFVDLMLTLDLIGDAFFKEIAALVDAPSNEAYLSILQLNTLRNTIVHRMGTVDEGDIPKAIKIAENVMEKFLARLVIDDAFAFPQLKVNGEDSLISQALEYGTHCRLNFTDITIGMFG